MSVEERIRRAEDIYNRRNGGYSRVVPKERTSERKDKTKKSTVKRLFMQIFVCLSIYVIFYAVTNRDYVFSEEFRNEVNTFFTQKIKIPEFYNNAKAYVQSIFNNSNENSESMEAENSAETNAEAVEQKNEENAGDTKENSNEEINTTGETSTTENQDENIGGASEDTEQTRKEQEDNKQVAEADKKDEDKELSEQEQMEKDAKEIKSKISFIAPIQGRISSTFGWRNPTTATVPKYHTGLDIAATEGTVIKSATDGKVILVSTTGDYGKHYQIQIEDIVIVYAHCKTLYLKEGTTVKQGQQIGEVGSTGNSTGPHLHFEIRKGNEKIDPQLILNI